MSTKDSMREPHPSRRDLIRLAASAGAVAAAGGALARPAGAEEGRAKPYVPSTISVEAQAVLKSWPASESARFPDPGNREAWKQTWDENEAAKQAANEAVVREYGATVASKKLGGVPVLDVRPKGWRNSRRVLVYVHGGAYTLNSAASTLISAVPHAHDTGLRVISIDYTCAPFSRFQETSDQVVAVIKALLDGGYATENMGVYGDSAGAALAAGSVLKMRDRGMLLPAAVILQSPWADIGDGGDTYHTLAAADPLLDYAKVLRPSALAYADPKDHRHPYVSPVYADYEPGFPPTLIQGGTKEIFLSNFVRLYRVMDAAQVRVKLDLHEGMWHVFQALHHDLPESKQARAKVAYFLKTYLV